MTLPASSSGTPEPEPQVIPEVTPQPAPEPKSQPEPKTENWQERFAGLQRAFNAERDAKTALQSQLNAVQAHTSELEKALEDSGKTTTTLTTDLQTEKERIAALDQKVKRQELIMSKFPHLASFEGEGLLPPAPVEELEAVLNKFVGKLADEQTQKNLMYQQGAVPNPPAPQKGTEEGGDAPNVLLQKAITAQIKGDRATYESLMKEYYRKVSVVPSTA